MKCPVCQSHLTSKVKLEALYRVLPPTLSMIVRLIKERGGLTAEELAGEIYSRLPDSSQPMDGPLAIRSCIKRRDRLKDLGWDIVTDGSHPATYYLRPIKQLSPEA